MYLKTIQSFISIDQIKNPRKMRATSNAMFIAQFWPKINRNTLGIAHMHMPHTSQHIYSIYTWHLRPLSATATRNLHFAFPSIHTYIYIRRTSFSRFSLWCILWLCARCAAMRWCLAARPVTPLVSYSRGGCHKSPKLPIRALTARARTQDQAAARRPTQKRKAKLSSSELQTHHPARRAPALFARRRAQQPFAIYISHTQAHRRSTASVRLPSTIPHPPPIRPHQPQFVASTPFCECTKWASAAVDDDGRPRRECTKAAAAPETPKA